ncbi:MAG TPA: BTAD domain-containing putative transcriptional regulator [Actinophytocola sp.]|uniref:AfsR/SARP family transcriptional regulator n=1 Tax=Actinophytocola sp. TaxID=1872138 RepID=UPI002DBB1C91|nr:BTAD domain-containing putative transcriptional regulator [Actinophytocola sp.]HEU5471612.1 BTAD domain-containing putative transcriptional regulator [Actinophytocola sp.]
MEFRLLGEMQIWAADEVMEIGPPRQQAVLAVLAVDAGRPVPIETLVDRLWPDAPPAEARNVLYSHLSRIRQLLKRGADRTGIVVRIDRRIAGYVLEIDPDRVDLHRFARLAAGAANPRRPAAERAAELAEALRLWRGPPLAGMPGAWAEQVRASWQRRRLDAAVRWGELATGLGDAVAVIGPLSDLAAEHPLAEALEGVLMSALHAAGRAAEALERYAALRRRLADELGTDPGPELKALHRTILRGEPASPDRGISPAVPAQLPPDVPGFAGRDPELRRLDELAAARIVTVSGTAGVGKTTLAVHWAHRMRDRFPGGQLYLNLRGFDPSGAPVTPTEAVRTLLAAFDLPSNRIPAGFEAQVGLYRSLLADRRVLILLDNARDAEQVRPLLPATPDCLALVTSRDLLAGLVAGGARPVSLDLLDPAAARELVAGRIGADRIATEPRAVDEIVRLCAGLPLALAVVSARAATHPTFGLAALAGELRDARGGLDEFAGADPATDARAVFSWSYLQLSLAAARMFRLIGLHPGPDLGVRAAASLAGLPVGGVRPLLAELARAHLVAEHKPGRYTCHDLLRAYAAELAHATESAADLHAATRRILGHYVHSAANADRLIDIHWQSQPELTGVPPGVSPERMTGKAAALAWFVAEHRVLLLAVHQDREFDPQVWELAWTARRFLAHQGLWYDELDMLSAALEAAQRLGDPAKEAFAQCYIGCTYVWLDKYEDAHAFLLAAQDLYAAAGDEVGSGYVEFYLSWMFERQDRIGEALAHTLRALELFGSAGHRPGQGRCLNAVGWFRALLGDHAAAIGYCRQALDLQTELGDRVGAGETWHSLGYAHEQLGELDRAIVCYRAAVEQFREAEYRINEARSLAALGDAYHQAADTASARAAWRAGIDIFNQLGHPEADVHRVKLTNSPQGTNER